MFDSSGFLSVNAVRPAAMRRLQPVHRVERSRHAPHIDYRGLPIDFRSDYSARDTAFLDKLAGMYRFGRMKDALQLFDSEASDWNHDFYAVTCPMQVVHVIRKGSSSPATREIDSQLIKELGNEGLQRGGIRTREDLAAALAAKDVGTFAMFMHRSEHDLFWIVPLDRERIELFARGFEFRLFVV